MGAVNPHRDFFLKNGMKIYMQVVIPYLKLTREKREEAWETPSELVNETLDLIGDQESETVQVYAA